MKIHKSLNEIAYENTYYLENEHHILVIDPGSNWQRIQSKIESLGKPVAAILLTHTHYDHILSLDLLREAYGKPPVYVAEEESDWLFTPAYNLSGLDRHKDLPDVILDPAEETFVYHQDYHLAGFHFYVLPTPGHSAGGVSFVFPEDHLVITGDALFRESIGRTDLYTGDYDQLITGIKTQLLTLPSSYTVYPGHGPSTTIGHEKMFNPHLK